MRGFASLQPSSGLSLELGAWRDATPRSFGQKKPECSLDAIDKNSGNVLWSMPDLCELDQMIITNDLIIGQSRHILVHQYILISPLYHWVIMQIDKLCKRRTIWLYRVLVASLCKCPMPYRNTKFDNLMYL